MAGGMKSHEAANAAAAAGAGAGAGGDVAASLGVVVQGGEDYPSYKVRIRHSVPVSLCLSVSLFPV